MEIELIIVCAFVYFVIKLFKKPNENEVMKAQYERVISLQKSHYFLLNQKLTTMAKTLDEVLTIVEENETVGDSIVALLTEVKTQLDEVLSGEKLSPAAQAKVDAIFEKVQSDTTKLQDAIVANTPAENPPPPPTEEPTV